MPSRWDEITGSGGTPAAPSPGRLAYLLPLSAQLGRCVNNGFGPQAVPHSEVEAFARMEGLHVQEARALRMISERYVAGLSRGKDVFATPPWEGSDDD